MTRIKPLKLNKMCASLTYREIAVLARFIEEESYSKGKTIFKEGDLGDKAYMIVKGDVGIKSTFLGGEGGGKVNLTLKENDFFGELSLFEAGPRRASTIALADDTILFSISRKSFQDLCHSEPFVSHKLIMEVIGVFSSKLREGKEELDKLLTSKGSIS